MKGYGEPNNLGLIHLYYGDGKGKTTAAIGLAIRAIGNNKKVLFAQFLKGGQTGELAILQQLSGIEVVRKKACDKLSIHMNNTEKEDLVNCHNQLLSKVISLVGSNNYDLLILDEVVGACRKNLIDVELFEKFIRNKQGHLEVIMTGRNPLDFMLELADYQTEMKKIKHPYDRGIPARLGIEK